MGTAHSSSLLRAPSSSSRSIDRWGSTAAKLEKLEENHLEKEETIRKQEKRIKNLEKQLEIATDNIRRLNNAFEVLRHDVPSSTVHVDLVDHWKSRPRTEEEAHELDREAAPYEKLLKESKKKPGK